jgi:hypothetical protein
MPLLLSLVLLCQSPSAGVPARIVDMAWLVGAWEGEGLGGQVDEVWSPAAGGAMVGHFRLIRNGVPVFYELITILEVGASLEMRLKHVNPDMAGWEEKTDYVTFKLVSIDATEANFGAFRLIRKGPNGWDGVLRMRQGDRVTEERFTFRRATGR